MVSLARRAIEEYLDSERKLEPEKGLAMQENGGVFVTLEGYPEKEPPGRSGYRPAPLSGSSVVDAALCAAFEGSLPPIGRIELEKTVVGVSVLTAPEEITVESPEEYREKIKVGRDGLSIQYGYASGILLPQVPVEWNWNSAEFLGHLCKKAGLPPDMWRSPSAKISRFEAQIFCEEKPCGKVLQKRLIR